MEWTDDMTVRIARGRSLLALVRYLRSTHEGRREVLAELTEQYALSFDDARLAMDRVAGGTARARSGNPANEPDPAKDPLAWMSYRLELGQPVEDEAAGPTPGQLAAAAGLVDRARRGESTRGTTDVVVALEVVRHAVGSTEPARTRLRLLLQAATAVSAAAEACIERLGDQPCAQPGTQLWVDGVALTAAARQVTALFAAQPDPHLEEQGLSLVGRTVTRLLGQCHAFVGRAMVESARCLQRNHGPEAAAAHAAAVLIDFQPLLDQPPSELLVEEDLIALEYLQQAIDIVIEGGGLSQELEELRDQTIRILNRPTLA